MDSEVYEALLEAASEDDLLKEIDASDICKKTFKEMRLQYDRFLKDSSGQQQRQDDQSAVELSWQVGESLNYLK